MHRSRTLSVLSIFLVLVLTTMARADLPESPVCGDVNDNGQVNAGDALLVLKKGVGQPVTLNCGDALELARYGHVDQLPGTSSFSYGVLLGTKVSIANDALITHLGVLGIEAGPFVQLALYSDSAGEPADLVVSTSPKALAVGAQEIPVVATNVTVGDYWLMATFDDTAAIGYETNVGSSVVKWVYHTLGFPLPQPFGTPQTYAGQIFNMWVRAVE